MTSTVPALNCAGSFGCSSCPSALHESARLPARAAAVPRRVVQVGRNLRAVIGRLLADDGCGGGRMLLVGRLRTTGLYANGCPIVTWVNATAAFVDVGIC